MYQGGSGQPEGEDIAGMDPNMPKPLIRRRRSDRLSPRDQALKEKLLRGTWTRRELEWLRDADPRLPMMLCAIVNGKLRELEEKPFDD
jgi:hypothetical protein